MSIGFTEKIGKKVLTTEYFGDNIHIYRKIQLGGDKMIDIRDCLKPAIEDAGFKQMAVAEKVGLNYQQLSDVINKRRKLDANELISICNALGITPDKLLTYGISETDKKVG